MIPKIIHQVAPEDKKRWSKEWFVCDESWKKVKGYERKIWNDREDIDNFIEKYDPYILDLLNKFPLIYKIDYVRYLIAEKIGGIITDMDFEIIRDFTPHLDGKSIYLLDSFSNDETYQNGFMISPPSSVWTGFLGFVRNNLIENQEKIIARYEIPNAINGTFVRTMVGPIALSNYFNSKNIEHKILPHCNFNPYGKYNKGDFVFTKHYGTGNWGGL